MKTNLRIAVAAGLAAAFLSPAQAADHEIYGKAGFLGVGIGYAYGINERFTVRGDITTAGSYSHDGSSSDFDYTAKLRNNVGTLYGDWFPFNNGFRVTAGVGVRQTRVTADGRPNSAGQVTIGDTTINYGANDAAWAKVEYPTVTPYLGIGWGHNVGQASRAGWTFIADAGVYYGKPKVHFDVNDSVFAKLNLASGGNAQQEVDKQRNEIEDQVRKYKFIPAVYVGIGYRF